MKIDNFFTDYGWIDITKFNTFIFNKDMYYIGEIVYNCFLINNQLKLLILLGFFALLPFITFLDFILTHCTKLRCGWFTKNFGSKFFFGATFLLVILMALPMGTTAILELYKLEVANEY